MELQAAIEAHKNKDNELALDLYQKAYDGGINDPTLFQNFGALLREAGKNELSRQVYERGLSLYPAHISIWSNYANLLQGTHPVSSLAAHLNVLYFARKQGTSSERYHSIVGKTLPGLLSLLETAECKEWLSSFLIEYADEFDNNANILLNLLKYSDAHQNTYLANIVETKLSNIDTLQQLEVQFCIASHHATLGDMDKAVTLYDKSIQLAKHQVNVNADLQRAIDVHSWNFACALLKTGDFERGWSLFDYGLRAPAASKQKWQRALFKPYSVQQVPMWRGESLDNKRLLILEEQAIGDVMMFATLLPEIINECRHLTFIVNKRLYPIYKRSFERYINNGRLRLLYQSDIKTKSIHESNFDYQCPIGSICQYRFTKYSDYGKNLPILIAGETTKNKYRRFVLEQSSVKSPSKIVGISWRGGAGSVRLKQKSIDLSIFTLFLQHFPDLVFVNLQYGNVSETVNKWKDDGINIVSIPEVDPLRNMDQWLSLTAACDSVVSVANTTIHGSGGLNIPTLCLLGLNSDWRWNDNFSKNYWYPSVDIARQEKNNSSWNRAIKHAKLWLAK